MRSMHSDPEQNALRDILRQIDPAQNFAQGQDRDAFSADIMRVYAVTRCLEIISGSPAPPLQGLKERHPSIVWRGREPSPETSSATIISPALSTSSSRRAPPRKPQPFRWH